MSKSVLDKIPRGWFNMWGTPGVETWPNVIVKWRCISHSRDGFCTIGKSYLYPKSRPHLSSRVVAPLQSSPFYDVHYFSCTHINKARAAGTESADCVTVWPLGQASFLVPPVLTLACERLKLFQIFPLNIYPARTPHGKIPGSGMNLGCNDRIWTAVLIAFCPW